VGLVTAGLDYNRAGSAATTSPSRSRELAFSSGGGGGAGGAALHASPRHSQYCSLIRAVPVRATQPS